MIDFSTPLAGLNRASSAVDLIASRLAKSPSIGEDTVGLSSEAVALLVARQNFESNLSLLKTADRLNQALLNLLG
jgi:hypothetical protein